MSNLSKYNGGESPTSKKAYNDFCNKLNEINAELLSFYTGAKDSVKIKLNDIILEMSPDSFKNKTYKSICNFFSNLEKEGDTFLEFSKVGNGNVLFAKIKTFDNAIKEISINLYTTFTKGRRNYYNFFKGLNYKHTAYLGGDEPISVFLEGDYRMNATPENFKYFTNKSIQNFKKQLSKEGDKLLEFTGVDDKNRLLSKIRTFNGGITEVPIMSYSRFIQARKSLFLKAQEISAEIISPYSSDRENVTFKFDEVEISVTPNNFKRQTYVVVKDFIKQLNENGDKFIEFIDTTKNNNLIAKIYTIDDGEVTINTANYKTFIEGRKRTFDYAKENNIELKSHYIGANDELIVDFGCKHGFYATTPHNLKRSYGDCPYCFSSKGEEEIAKFLTLWGYDFVREKRFKECKREGLLPFDFYIESLNLCIEFDGIQHYEAVKFYSKTAEEAQKAFEIRQLNDNIKNQFCKDNEIKLLRIPYYEYDNIEQILSKIENI